MKIQVFSLGLCFSVKRQTGLLCCMWEYVRLESHHDPLTQLILLLMWRFRIFLVPNELSLFFIFPGSLLWGWERSAGEPQRGPGVHVNFCEYNSYKMLFMCTETDQEISCAVCRAYISLHNLFYLCISVDCSSIIQSTPVLFLSSDSALLTCWQIPRDVFLVISSAEVLVCVHLDPVFCLWHFCFTSALKVTSVSSCHLLEWGFNRKGVCKDHGGCRERLSGTSSEGTLVVVRWAFEPFSQCV